MPKKSIWLTFDLGVKGDYENLYAWLDKHGAEECGDNIAYIQYEYSTKSKIATMYGSSESLLKALKVDIKKSINIQERNRIYVIYREDTSPNKIKGHFLFGARKSSPWKGFSPNFVNASDEGN